VAGAVLSRVLNFGSRAALLGARKRFPGKAGTAPKSFLPFRALRGTEQCCSILFHGDLTELFVAAGLAAPRVATHFDSQGLGNAQRRALPAGEPRERSARDEDAPGKPFRDARAKARGANRLTSISFVG
jgi:hypothetical protein